MKRTPLKRKSATKKRRVTGCTVRSCKRRGPFTAISETERLCKFHLGQEADRTWSKVVRLRDGRCMAAEMFPAIECWGALQAMHIVPRSYRVTRWELANGRAGCAAHHKYLTEHPLEHWEWARATTPFDYTDEDSLENLKYRAMTLAPAGPLVELRSLRLELETLGAA